ETCRTPHVRRLRDPARVSECGSGRTSSAVPDSSATPWHRARLACRRVLNGTPERATACLHRYGVAASPGRITHLASGVGMPRRVGRLARVNELERIREIALALPEVNERISHREPCFYVQHKRPLCYFHDNHNGDGRISLWCPAPDGVQEEMVSADPERFFAPPTSSRVVLFRVAWRLSRHVAEEQGRLGGGRGHIGRRVPPRRAQHGRVLRPCARVASARDDPTARRSESRGTGRRDDGRSRTALVAAERNGPAAHGP